MVLDIGVHLILQDGTSQSCTSYIVALLATDSVVLNVNCFFQGTFEIHAPISRMAHKYGEPK